MALLCLCALLRSDRTACITMCRATEWEHVALLHCTNARPASQEQCGAFAEQGWRFAFYAVAVTSAAAAVAILALGTDPTPRRPAADSGKVRQFTDARSLVRTGRNRAEVWQGATSPSRAV